MRVVSALCLLIGSTGSLQAASLSGTSPAAIAKSGTAWKLENDALKSVVSFANGRIDMTSFYNKAAETEYLTGPGSRCLFSYDVNGSAIAANDGGWSFISDTISDISLYGKSWGKQLSIVISRTTPVNIRIKLVFEIYHGPAGLRYSTFLKNNSDAEQTVRSSDIIALNFPNAAHTTWWVSSAMNWQTNTGSPGQPARCCFVRYDTGDGWSINPENNRCTSLAPGGYKGDDAHPFLHINAWKEIDNVKVYTDTQAVQLVLFPREEMEYFATNLEVFKGDKWDARIAVAEHLRQRFKFISPRVYSLNDWDWFSSGRRTDSYYRDTVTPIAVAAGFDEIHVDDQWNGKGTTFVMDEVTPLDSFTKDLPALASYIESKGLKLGLWFSPTGGGWGGGRDIADPAQIAIKQRQFEDTLVGKYKANWTQLDLGILWKNAEVTPYSHPSDNVYRKSVNLRNYCNYFAHKYPGIMMQPTCEVDNGDPNNKTFSLHAFPDNGACAHAPFDVRTTFNTIGIFPLEGEFKGFNNAWKTHTDWLYESLMVRHNSYYQSLDGFTTAIQQQFRRFNDWRKNPRIQPVLNELLRPVYSGPDDNNGGPFSWMYVDRSKSKAIVIGLGDINTSTPSITAPLRWLDPAKTYLIEDITLLDNGTWSYAFKGKAIGAQLAAPGLPIALSEAPSRAKAYWLQELAPAPLQVLYADAAVSAYAESRAGNTLKVDLKGNPGASATVICYKTVANATESKSVTLDASGCGAVAFTE